MGKRFGEEMWRSIDPCVHLFDWDGGALGESVLHPFLHLRAPCMYINL
jgi:hypothetical protein